MKSPITSFLESLNEAYAPLMEGKVADYIPELAKADPRSFGIALATTDGQVYEVGDTQKFFTIQSISKPFVYGIALEDHGLNHVLSKVGVEPTGDAFNSISLDPVTGRPANPMINAGAIATSSLVKGKTSQEKTARILESFGRYTGRKLTIDDVVYQSEHDTGHRNRAISHLLRNFNIIEVDPEPSLDAYFKQCSISVTCRDLALMAATLANNGINPVTRIKAVSADYVENILSLMATCGMYDYAGEWIYRIGMPAKSGVGGGIVAVLPGQLGVGIFSPPLDALGNSVRGIKVCEKISQSRNLHLFRVPNASASVVRRISDGKTISSNRQRSEKETASLQEHGQEIQILEIQGEITFSAMERVIRQTVSQAERGHLMLLNFRHVTSVNASNFELLLELWRLLRKEGKPLVLAEIQHLPEMAAYLTQAAEKIAGEKPLIYPDLDSALEWAENQLLAKNKITSDPLKAEPKDYALLKNFTEEEVGAVVKKLKTKRFNAGDLIMQTGDKSSELFFLKQGQVSILVENETGFGYRVATYVSGMAFGEIALLDHAPRSATVKADTSVECHLLTTEDYQELLLSHPAIMVKFLQNMAFEFSRGLRKSNRILRTLMGKNPTKV